jgi:hypothetical protein
VVETLNKGATPDEEDPDRTAILRPTSERVIAE